MDRCLEISKMLDKTAVWGWGNFLERISFARCQLTISPIGTNSVQLFSRVRLLVTSWTAVCQDFLSFINSQSLLKLMSIELVMPFNQPFHPLLSPSPPAFKLSQHQGLSQWVSSSHQVAKHWSFSFSISPSIEYSGRISFRIDRFDLLVVQGTLKSLLKQYSSKASILWYSFYCMVQHSHSHMTTGKTIALTTQTIVGKVMSLLFNMLPRFLIAFLPRSKHFLILWLQSPSVVILKSMKVCHSFHCFPNYLPWGDGTRCHDFCFLNVEFKPAFSLSSFTFIKRLFSSSLLSALRVVSSAYLRLLIFLLTVLIPACASSSPVFLMMYSAYKLNKQGDNI